MDLAPRREEIFPCNEKVLGSFPVRAEDEEVICSCPSRLGYSL